MESLDLALAQRHHLLLVADDVADEEVEALALSRYPAAGRRDGRTIDLTATARLDGPWAVEPATTRALGLPRWTSRAYALVAPAERGDPVPPALRGLGGILDAFADGQPVGEEAEVLDFLQALARRLAGAVRAAGSGVVIEPEPQAGVDLRVHSEVWLHPEALVRVLQGALPGLELLTEAGPAPVPGPAVDLPDGTGLLDPDERAWIHAEADAFDAQSLSGQPVIEAYGAVWGFDDGATISASVEADVSTPLVLEGLDWARSGVITYELRWYPADPEAYHAGRAPARVLAQRDEARSRIEAAARSLLEAVGGETTDDDGFLVDP